MTTNEGDIDRMEAAILTAMRDGDQSPAWATPDDLSRISIEALIAEGALGRTLPSHGTIRVTGDGLAGASARVSEVARVMTEFRRLATAVGAALQGDKELGRRPNADIRRRTDLLLTASPGPGSIILSLTPASSPITETGYGGGQVDMFAELETQDQLLDTAIGATIDVFAAGNDIGPAPAESVFVRQLGQMGPRTASAVRDLSKTLNRARFDLEIDWQQPARATRRVKVSATTAAHIAATVENANLDEQPIPLVGEYLTVSSVQSWLIRQDDGEALTVKLGHLNENEIHGLGLGMRVRIDA
jgi:hypothetical protein